MFALVLLVKLGAKRKGVVLTVISSLLHFPSATMSLSICKAKEIGFSSFYCIYLNYHLQGGRVILTTMPEVSLWHCFVFM